MSKIAVVYWSGTGNTETMASLVAAGAKEAGAETDLFTAGEFGPDRLDAYDAVAAPPWERSSWRRRNLNRCSPLVRGSWQGKGLGFLALTAGAMESGCAPGRTHAVVMGRT